MDISWKIENYSYIILDSALLESCKVVSDTDNSSITCKCFNDKEIRLKCNKLCTSQDYNYFINNLTCDISQNGSICYVYGTPAEVSESTFGIEVIMLAVESFLKENVEDPIKKKYRTISDVKMKEAKGLYFCLLGVKDGYCYELLHKHKKHEFINIDGIQITSASMLSKILQNKLFETDTLAYEQYIYVFVYGIKNLEGILQFGELYYIDLQNTMYAYYAEDEKVNATIKNISKKQLFANSKVWKNVLITNNKIYSVMKLNIIDDILQGDYLQNFIIEFTNIKSFEDRYLPSDVPSLKHRIRHLEKTVTLMQNTCKRQLKNLDKKVRQEVVDQLTEIHSKLTQSQRDNFNRLLEDTDSMYTLKLETLEHFYEAKMIALKRECSMSADSEEEKKRETKKLLDKILYLEKQIAELTKEKEQNIVQVKILHDRLTCIKNALEGNSTALSEQEEEDKENAVSSNGNPAANNINLRTPKSEVHADSPKYTTGNVFIKAGNQELDTIKDLQTKLGAKDILLNKAYAEIEKLKSQINNEMNQKFRLVKELMTAECTATQFHRELIECFSDPTNDVEVLREEKRNMEKRHQEQFQKYEKMLKKNREEIESYERELRVVRQHFIFGKNSPLPNRSNILKQIGTPTSNVETPKTQTVHVEAAVEESSRKLRSGKKIGG